MILINVNKIYILIKCWIIFTFITIISQLYTKLTEMYPPCLQTEKKYI